MSRRSAQTILSPGRRSTQTTFSPIIRLLDSPETIPSTTLTRSPDQIPPPPRRSDSAPLLEFLETSVEQHAAQDPFRLSAILSVVSQMLALDAADSIAPFLTRWLTPPPRHQHLSPSSSLWFYWYPMYFMFLIKSECSWRGDFQFSMLGRVVATSATRRRNPHKGGNYCQVFPATSHQDSEVDLWSCVVHISPSIL